MKKLLSLLMLILLLVGCSSNQVNTNDRNDSNDDTACGLESECDDENSDYYLLKDMQITMKEARELIENKEDAVLYFYFNACPWCKELGPLLSDYISDKEDLKAITHSINVRPTDNKETDLRYKNDDGEYNDEDFAVIKEFVYDYLIDYDGTDTFYTPTVIFLKDGDVKYFHVGTLEGQDASENALTEEETKELNTLIEEYYSIYKD